MVLSILGIINKCTDVNKENYHLYSIKKKKKTIRDLILRQSNIIS